MKKIFLLIFPLWLMVACASSSSQEIEGPSVNLSGKVGFPQSGEIVLSRYVDASGAIEVIDTIALQEDYTYNQEVPVPVPGYYKLDFYGKQVLNIILQEDDMVINVDGNQQQGFWEVEGSLDHDYLIGFNQAMQQFNQSPQLQELNQAFVTAQQSGDNEAMDSLRIAYLTMDKAFKEELLQAADTMRTSLGVVEVLRNKQLVDPDIYYDYLKRYSVRVKEDLSDAPVAMEFVNSVENMERLAIGALAPEISLPNPAGEIVPLSSLRGKYVLLDFWAQWCRPCRMENPNVVAMYNKYHDQGFEVYGVSLDKTREKWLQAIEEDELHWTQVSDLKFWRSEAAQTYNITAIPFSLLLDPDGKIIGKNLRGPVLQERLSEIFD